MNQLNNIILEGTLINEPEVVAKSAVTNSRLVKFTIANDRFYKDVNGNSKQETLFLVIQCWGNWERRHSHAFTRAWSSGQSGGL